ncbi:MAG: glycosyltransferase [Pseudomonadota bacterium]
MAQMTCATRSSPAPAEVWVLGSFSLTGAALVQHACSSLMVAAETGIAARAVSFHPGAFADNSVEDMSTEGPQLGVIYLRTLLRLSGRRPERAWIRRWRSMNRLIARSARVAVITTRPALQWMYVAEILILFVLLCRFPHRVAWHGLRQNPYRIMRGMGLITAAPVTNSDAEDWTLRTLSDRSINPLRLAEAHVLRALNGAAGAALSPAAARQIRDLTRIAATLKPRDIEAAARRADQKVTPRSPRPFRAAYAPGLQDKGSVRIVEHMRLLRLARRNWIRFAPAPPSVLERSDSLGGAILRDLAGAGRPEDATLVAPLRRALLAAPGGLTGMEWMRAVALRLPISDADTLAAPWSASTMAKTLRARWAEIVPGTPSQSDAVTVAGFTENETGLALNLAMSAAALRHAGIPVTIDPVDANRTAENRIPDTAQYQCLRPTAIYHLNADRLPQTMLNRAPAYGIGFLLWELDRLPKAHRLALEMLDEIWVPSVFLRHVYQRNFDRKVVFMRKALVLPPAASMPKPKPGTRRFITCFDAGSSVARKNPLAAVEAFRMAFPTDPDVELVIKSTPTEASHWGDPEDQMRRIDAIAAHDPRIRVIRQHLPMRQLLGLISTATALVSPHRAEGFGYFPAFALSLGVPVVVTDHGGTRDFCTPETSAPVRAELVPVPRGHAIFETPGARWAEIDVTALARALKDIAEDPAPALRRAHAGQLMMQTDYALPGQAKRYAARLTELGLIAPRDSARDSGLIAAE